MLMKTRLSPSGPEMGTPGAQVGDSAVTGRIWGATGVGSNANVPGNTPGDVPGLVSVPVDLRPAASGYQYDVECDAITFGTGGGWRILLMGSSDAGVTFLQALAVSADYYTSDVPGPNSGNGTGRVHHWGVTVPTAIDHVKLQLQRNEPASAGLTYSPTNCTFKIREISSTIPGLPPPLPPSPPSPAGVPLLTAANYAVLAKTGITNVPTSAVVGNMGISPAAATAITGFSLSLDIGGAFATSAQVTGQVFAANYVAPTPATLTQAVIDMQAAYVNAAGRAPDFTEFHAGLLNGETLVPGVYKWSTGVAISGDITLHGGPSEVFIFEIAGVLSLAGAKQIHLTGGVLPQNVFWQVAGNVAIGVAATFNGTILCLTDITLGAGAIMTGKCLSQTAVNLASSHLN